MINVLAILPILVIKLMASDKFWKEISKCAAGEYDAEFSFIFPPVNYFISITHGDAVTWITYFGRSANENEIEKWQHLMRQQLIRGINSSDTTENSRFAITLQSSKFSDPTIIFIPDSPKENALIIKIDAPGASCEQGGDGFGRD